MFCMYCFNSFRKFINVHCKYYVVQIICKEFENDIIEILLYGLMFEILVDS